ncbi:hypothetical protein DICVIV_08615 [Dictyocaulus viviparus]|uniref:CUE domain-containing protein n=1 Tax=Dictyocaulus viviparus TaxID=29172 RepID=A0A0D8XNG9_DICVI|nr:hypothetical protein DICVIV_08615 [Dictyocaulus viviparus]
MDYEATVNYLENLFPKVGKEEICWAYIEADGDIDKAAELILDGQYIAVKLQRAQDALHRHETDEVNECLMNRSAEDEDMYNESYVYDDDVENRDIRMQANEQTVTSKCNSLSYHSSSDSVFLCSSRLDDDSTNYLDRSMAKGRFSRRKIVCQS